MLERREALARLMTGGPRGKGHRLFGPLAIHDDDLELGVAALEEPLRLAAQESS